MDVSENQSSPMSLEGGNSNIEEQSKLHVQFPKELLIVDERKINNANATSNSVEEGFNADNMVVSIDIVYLENFPA